MVGKVQDWKTVHLGKALLSPAKRDSSSVMDRIWGHPGVMLQCIIIRDYLDWVD